MTVAGYEPATLPPEHIRSLVASRQAESLLILINRITITVLYLWMLLFSIILSPINWSLTIIFILSLTIITIKVSKVCRIMDHRKDILLACLILFATTSAAEIHPASINYNSLNTSSKFVLTGGPGVGKSTVINLLQNHGYQVAPESWTMLFDEARKNNRLEAFLSSTNSVAFRRTLMEAQLGLERSLDKNKLAFLDRSTVDVVAFGNFYNITMPQSITDVLKQERYDIIFFLDPLPKDQYQKGDLCSQEESIKIHQHLKRFYKYLGYSVVDIPFDNPEKRMEFILSAVCSYQLKLGSLYSNEIDLAMA